MLIADFDVYGRAAEFDPATGRLGPARAVDAGQRTHGHYGRVGRTGVVFYRGADGLRIRVGECDIRLDAATTVRHRIVEPECVLTVGRIAELRYPVPPQWYGLAEDLTPFVEAEDFDLGLFVANVLADPDRADRSYR
ncbi:hypothetical protein [Streptomyces sp. CBMA123]|uniref:hypothetical protein n=1 Tax=Streptomyces sp. CBMA123 TaxID=1896313 RepID=UPI001661DDED|nr:hypothetical protein [Streptomyces sp. CBMA123]MBD0689495.1 hypothetical protein [Streptomyces sp. CBMA123]